MSGGPENGNGNGRSLAAVMKVVGYGALFITAGLWVGATNARQDARLDDHDQDIAAQTKWQTKHDDWAGDKLGMVLEEIKDSRREWRQELVAVEQDIHDLQTGQAKIASDNVATRHMMELFLARQGHADIVAGAKQVGPKP